jgi:phenylacetate-CoA ligase
MYHKLLFYLKDFLLGSYSYSLVKYFKQLENNKKGIEIVKRNKLLKVLRWAYDTVPFYRKLMSKLKLNPHYDDPYYVLSKLPIINKNVVRSNFPDFISRNVWFKMPVQTSGSTGTPLTLYHDLSVIRAGLASFYYGLSWYGYNLGDKIIRLWGRRPVVSRTSIIKNFLSNYLSNVYDLNAHAMNEKNMLNYYYILRKEKPKVLYGYVSSLFLLGRFIKNKDLEPPPIGFIVTTAEVLNKFQRESLISSFESKVYDQYGSVEIPSIAFECPFHEGMHVMENRVILELLKDGCEVDNGEMGTVVVTDLDNFVMPLIRYNLEDIAEKKDSTCSCGRRLQLIGNIVGRTSDIIIGLNGNRVHGEFFSHLIESSGIAQKNVVEKFQVIQKSKEKIIFKIKSRIPLSEEDFYMLTTLIRRHLGNIEIIYQQVDDIEPHPSGKYRFTISEVDINAENL